MTLRRFLPLAVLVAVSALATIALAARATPLVANFSTNLIPTTNGVFDDGDAFYHDGWDGVSCYLGVGSKNVVLVTYNTGRKLNFVFDPNSDAWKRSELSPSVFATVDLYGVNNSGSYTKMPIGSAAEVRTTVQFYVGNNTYVLVYESLGAVRESQNKWLLTSSLNDLPGGAGFSPSDQAVLKLFRRKSPERFGTVNMPIRFEVTIAP
jgi:hypothetical protein